RARQWSGGSAGPPGGCGRCAGGQGARSRPGRGGPGGAVQVEDLLDGGGVLGGLVVAPAAGEAGEPQGQAGVGLEHPPGGGVDGGQGQLGPEDLDHQAGLEPDVGDHAGVDPGRRVGAGQGGQPPGEGGQLGVAEPGAALADGAEQVGLGVVGGQQQGPVDAAAAAPAGQGADHDQVQGVAELGAVVALELDPQPAPGPGL